MLFVFWTASSDKEAKKIVKKLLELRYIACATLFPQVTSFYIWDNALQEAEEVQVLMKTKEPLFSKIVEYIQEKSDSDVPEIVSVKAKSVAKSYENWVEEIVD